MLSLTNNPLTERWCYTCFNFLLNANMANTHFKILNVLVKVNLLSDLLLLLLSIRSFQDSFSHICTFLSFFFYSPAEGNMLKSRCQWWKSKGNKWHSIVGNASHPKGTYRNNQNEEKPWITVTLYEIQLPRHPREQTFYIFIINFIF